MTKRLAVMGAMLFLLTACHGYTTPRFDPDLYRRAHRFYDLTVFWKAEVTDDAVAIEGFVKNMRSAYVAGLKLTASLLDERGKILDEATFLFFPPEVLPQEAMKPFALKIPVKAGEKPVKVRFAYRYRKIEAGTLRESYFNIFEENLP